ncbi:MAG: LuxR C-terminal-related transcriptional regulator [Actinomycetia bacterium]|nr:LuxR C-terminal-related transcriptional regulator [Actinomycetes bacterium]
MSKNTNVSTQPDDLTHLVRPRLSALLEQAVKKSLVIVCAGAGYGKTRAVYDFVRDYQGATIWVQLSEQDNVTTRFWENFVRSLSQVIGTEIEDFRSLGFPDTEEKMQQYRSFRDRSIASHSSRRFLMIIDDFHLIHNPQIARFIEGLIQNTPEDRSFILISREDPALNISALQIKDEIARITEEDLNFTENELAQYLDRQDLPTEPQMLHEIYRDIKGWAFSVNLVARLLKRAPGYAGYAQNTMKKNLSDLMEIEVYDAASERLQRLLVRLSLIEHLSGDLVTELADNDEELLAELRQQNAFIRFDSTMHVYLIHHLFLDLLRSKQDLLSEEERQATWRLGAQWCRKHDYLVDALDYFDLAADHDAIVSILSELPFFLPYDLAQHLTDMFRRMPDESFVKVDLLAVMYLRAVLSLGDWQTFEALARDFEKRFDELPESDTLRKHSLGLICYLRGIMQYLMSITNEDYSFDRHFEEMCAYLRDAPLTPGIWLSSNLGPWATGFGAEKPEAARRYVESAAKMVACINICLPGIMNGMESLAAGELKFYQDSLDEAEYCLTTAETEAREARQFDIVHRSLFYLMRRAFALGKLDQADRALEGIGELLQEKDYPQRFVTNDLALGWYHYALRQPDMIPNWLKEDFSPYGHAFYPENFANQLKLRYHFMTKNYAPALAHIEEAKQRESILFGRVERLAIEACIHYQMRERHKAIATLKDLHDRVAHIGFMMPLAELGRDMRTLSAYALREGGHRIPETWLKAVNKRSALYARYQAQMIAAHEKKSGSVSLTPLSVRETEVLHDLYDGLSRTDIAARQNLSLSTVNMNIQSIYSKLHAKNVADVIRIAVEHRLL